MSTRALINIKKHNRFSDTLTTIYVHSDGYPDGLGQKIIDFIKNKKISNGVSNDCFNGMGCLAASLIAHLKTKSGEVYIEKPDTCDVWENYTYTLYRTGTKKLEFDERDDIMCTVDMFLDDLLLLED